MKETKRVVVRGVVAQYKDKFWGVTHDDGHSTDYGWVSIDKARVSDPEFCEKPTDMTHEGSHWVPELKKGKLVMIKITKIYELAT